jgi:ACT domain-containing protein
MVFQEEEGTTLVLDQAKAQSASLNGVFPCRMITLTIHSSLEAVGFLLLVVRDPLAEASDAVEDGIGAFGPDEGPWVLVHVLDVALDRLLQRLNAGEQAALEPVSGQQASQHSTRLGHPWPAGHGSEPRRSGSQEAAEGSTGWG